MDQTCSRSCFSVLAGERYVSGIGQVEPFDEVRREIIHQLSIRPMAHSELVKALPENVRRPSLCLSPIHLTDAYRYIFLPLQGNKETGLEKVIDSVASFKLVRHIDRSTLDAG